MRPSTRKIRKIARNTKNRTLAMLAAPAHRKLWLAGRLKRDEYQGYATAEIHLEDAAWAD